MDQPPPQESQDLPPPQVSQGFQMSSRRAMTEIVLVLVLVVGGVGLVIWGVAHASDLFIGQIPISVDETIGAQTKALLLAGQPHCTNPEPKQYVEAIARPMIDALGKSDFEFSFEVVKSSDVNAFALPGGFVTVNSGLLESAETGDEVAAVLSHELHHVTRRHGTRRMLRELSSSIVLSAIFGGTNVAVPASVVHDFASNAYSRDEESEADKLGLALMIKAGIDPRGMSRFFERLARSSLTPPALLSTHPDPGDRAELSKKAAENAKVTTPLPSPKGIVCQ
jgi:predicted Zn-dependent protease